MNWRNGLQAGLRRWAFAGVAGALGLLSACGEEQARDWSPFIELARQSNCADIRNQLHVITSPLNFEGSIVLHAREGSCADASYGQVLFGRTVEEVLCNNQDSIAGPVMQCLAPSYEDMFKVMIEHLDEPDLGLGSAFRVTELEVGS